MKKMISLFLTLIIVIGAALSTFAANDYDIDKVVAETASYIYETVKNPQVGSVGGEWAVLGLARSGCDIPDEYYQKYYENAEEYVTACNGILHNKKYTEYSRVTVALTAIGADPANVAGYNLLTPLGDFEKTIWQGINGPVWALIALDTGDYEMPVNADAKIQATRQMYIDEILRRQLNDGGWNLTDEGRDGKSDPDITGMALQALAKYQSQPAVKTATDKALNCLSNMQDDNGGFSSWGTANSESVVQVIVALCELGIDTSDSQFVKNGFTLLDNLMTYYSDDGSFRHTADGSGSNQMAAEQGFYGIVAVQRAIKGKNSLYRMSDAISLTERTETVIGLKNKNPDVQKMNIINPGKTFADIVAHKDITAIEALSSRGIINGKTENCFEPNSTMTRAEFATIIARGLGLPQKSSDVFKDVTADDWFYIYVGTAYNYGIIKGVSENEFNPNGTITREEAAVMVTRAASLCGMDTETDALAARDILAQFFDYVKTSDWSQSSLVFCYSEKILDDSVMEIKPKEAVTRAEIAAMLFHMLTSAKLM